VENRHKVKFDHHAQTLVYVCALPTQMEEKQKNKRRGRERAGKRRLDQLIIAIIMRLVRHQDWSSGELRQLRSLAVFHQFPFPVSNELDCLAIGLLESTVQEGGCVYVYIYIKRWIQFDTTGQSRNARIARGLIHITHNTFRYYVIPSQSVDYNSLFLCDSINDRGRGERC